MLVYRILYTLPEQVPRPFVPDDKYPNMDKGKQPHTISDREVPCFA